MPHFIGRLSTSASSHRSLSSAAFTTNIAESDFRHAHVYGELDPTPGIREQPRVMSAESTGSQPWAEYPLRPESDGRDMTSPRRSSACRRDRLLLCRRADRNRPYRRAGISLRAQWQDNGA